MKSIEYSAKSKEKYVEHTLVFHERGKSGECFLKNIIFLEKMDIPYSRKTKYVTEDQSFPGKMKILEQNLDFKFKFKLNFNLDLKFRI